ncbi:MAG: putative peptidoglycan glycosyltransferase FtsW [Gemmatimonadaceae bacterium]
MTAAVAPALMSGTRERWRMGTEARALLLVTACLLAFGLAVLYSASALAVLKDGTLYEGRFFTRQLMGALLGGVLFAFCSKIDAELWRKAAWPLMIASIVLMLITVLPFTLGLAPIQSGSRRFIKGSIQPSEFAKLAVVMWTAMLLVKKGDAVRRLGKGLVPFLLVVGGLSMLAALEPDYSVAATFCLLMALLLFVAGARVSHFVFLAALALPLLVQQAMQKKYIRDRVTSYLASESSTQTGNDAKLSSVSDQQRQALIAVGSGRVLGVGFGEGNQQRGWTPLAYNDFIASVVGEEFGFVGISGLVIAFAIYGWLGFRIARNARSPFCALIAVGLTFITVFTAFVHIGVSIGLLPNTGLTLPFVSGGRSNLVLTLLMTGVLVNIGSEKERVYGSNATDPLASLPS